LQWFNVWGVPEGSGNKQTNKNLAAASILRVRIAQSSAQCEVYFAILAVIVSVPCCALPPLQDRLKYRFGKIEMSFLFMLFLAMLLQLRFSFELLAT
jgi:hypothetical protein